MMGPKRQAEIKKTRMGKDLAQSQSNAGTASKSSPATTAPINQVPVAANSSNQATGPATMPAQSAQSAASL